MAALGQGTVRLGVEYGSFSFDRYRQDVAARLVKAAARATAKAAIGARDEIRTTMRSQRLGRLANVIGATSDLKKKRVPSGESGFDVGGFVFARVRSERTAGALASYLDNATTSIAPKGGKFLAIPTDQIPKRAGRKRMTPELYRATGLEDRIGPLTYVPGKHAGVAYLVVKATTVIPGRAGKARRLPKRGRVGKGRVEAGIVAFVLIRATRRTRRVDPRAIAARWATQLPALLEHELGGGGPAAPAT